MSAGYGDAVTDWEWNVASFQKSILKGWLNQKPCTVKIFITLVNSYFLRVDLGEMQFSALNKDSV